MPNWLGDVCMALPGVDLARRTVAARAGGGQVVLLAREPLAGFLRRCVEGVEVEAVDRRGRVVGGGAGPLDGVILLTNTVRPAWQAWRLGVPVRAGAGKRWLVRWLLSHCVAVSRPASKGDVQSESAPAGWSGATTVEGYLRTVRAGLAALGLEPGGAAGGEILLRPDGAALDAAAGWLSAHGVAPESGRLLIGYQAGAAYGTAKRYPVARLAEALGRVLEADDRAVCVGLGSMGEVEDLAAVRDALGGAFAGRVVVPESGLNLSAFTGLVSRLSLVVANDSGPMHVAVALGVPCVAIFGPTDWISTGYADGERYRLVRRPGLDCAPCMRRHCPLGHHRCMEEIGPERVAGAALELLGHARPGAGAARRGSCES